MARQRTEISFEGLHRPLEDAPVAHVDDDTSVSQSTDIIPRARIPRFTAYTFRCTESSLERARDYAAAFVPKVNIQDVHREAFELGLNEIARKAGF